MNQLLSYQEFFSVVKEDLEKRLPPELQLETGNRMRSGRRKTDTIEIRKDGEIVGMVFYADDMYHEYLRGAPPSLIADNIAQMCDSDLPCEPASILDYEFAKEHLLLRMDNYEKNKDRLEGVVYIRFLDLAITCRIMVPTKEKGLRTATVTESLLERWGISEEELFEQTGQCMMRHEVPVLRPIYDLLREMAPRETDIQEKRCAVHVLTNERGFSGASMFLVSAAVKDLAEHYGSDIMILPSSVHEVLLLPDTGDWKVDALRKIVEDINRNVVPPEDYLSDNVYRYRLKEQDYIIDS